MPAQSKLEVLTPAPNLSYLKLGMARGGDGDVYFRVNKILLRVEGVEVLWQEV